MVKTFFKSLLLPPVGLLLALLLIALLIKRRPRLGRTLLWIYLGLFYLLSVPFVATHLLLSLEWYPPLEESADIQSAGAIVVLSAAATAAARSTGWPVHPRPRPTGPVP